MSNTALGTFYLFWQFHNKAGRKKIHQILQMKTLNLREVKWLAHMKTCLVYEMDKTNRQNCIGPDGNH